MNIKGLERRIPEIQTLNLIHNLITSGHIVQELTNVGVYNPHFNAGHILLTEGPFCTAMDALWERSNYGDLLHQLGFQRRYAFPLSPGLPMGQVNAGKANPISHSYWLNPQSGYIFDLTPGQFAPYIGSKSYKIFRDGIMPRAPGDWIGFIREQIEERDDAHYIVDPGNQVNGIMYAHIDTLRQMGLEYR